MTYNDNNNRQRARMHDGNRGWGIPAALVAAVLIIGGLLYMNSGDDRTSTASNDRPAVTQPGPAGSQTPARSPTTAPAPKQ